jgi:hypothetical protein
MVFCTYRRRAGRPYRGFGGHSCVGSSVITKWNALSKSAENACLAQDESESDSNSPVLVEDPSFAYKATYRSIKAEYNSTMNDIFKAGFIGPSGYPRQIPSDWTDGPKDDFCSVSSQLIDLKATAE